MKLTDSLNNKRFVKVEETQKLSLFLQKNLPVAKNFKKLYCKLKTGITLWSYNILKIKKKPEPRSYLFE